MPDRRSVAPGVGWALLVLSVAVGLGCYVAARAWTLSFTHDESLSYLDGVRAPFWTVLLSRGTDANNHPLNTLGMKLGDALFGPSEIALRWSSVAGFVVYVLALAMILRGVERVPLRALGFVLAVANPYVLDFFSLARGYGLALAMVTASALFALDFGERPGARRALAASGCASVAVLANFATLTFYVALLVTLALAVAVSPRSDRSVGALMEIAAALTVPTSVVVLLAGVPLVRLRREGELYFGGDDGFWQDTVESLASVTLYRRGGDGLVVPLVVLVAAAVCVGAVATVGSLRRRCLPPHVVAYLLLTLPAVVSVVQHHVAGARFLIERTAIFFIPLLAIWLALAADAAARRPGRARTITAGAVVVIAAACVNVVTAANVSYVLDWRYDAATERFVGELAGTSSEPRRVRIGVSYLLVPATKFYRETRYGWLPECPSPDCLDLEADYYYVTESDAAVVGMRGARLLRVDPVSGAVIARAGPREG